MGSPKNLVIVESPAKAKTIEKFLGKDFVVKSSYGHICDLPEKKLSIDIEHNFKPQYEIPKDKKNIVKELKTLASKADTIWLATDEDREGEAISWHLKEALELPEEKTKRIVFHEITKPAILNAIQTPRNIDVNLVNAQQARRILDRLVGYEISPILWKKVKPALSAGRVQSVAVRLIVEREREIQNFVPQQTFKVTGEFLTSENKLIKAVLKEKFSKEEDALAFLEQCKNKVFQVNRIEKKPGKRSPAPPFTTSTLQQEASRKLGFPVSLTMSVAQKLYEEGFITYMRTDSVNLSKLAIEAAKNTIIQRFGSEYANPKQYVTKNKSAQEAHEAIRPTYLEKETVPGDKNRQRLYELIWKRTLASQMTDAQIEKTNVEISAEGLPAPFIATGEVLVFDGFLKVYQESKEDEEAENRDEAAGQLPKLFEGEELRAKEIKAVQRFSSPPPRYSEASLVRKLEELGIGRPSTYAPTISTIQKRGYVKKESREGVPRKYEIITLKNDKIIKEEKTEITGTEKNKLFPTDIGMVVNDFLVKHFRNILDYKFTAKVEQQFDEIAEGKLSWEQMIKTFYNPFHSEVEQTLQEAEKAKGERVLGKDPKTGESVIAKIGRYGPMIQIGEAESDKKPRFAKLQPGQSISTITLEEALKLFEFPKELGEYNGQKVEVNVGRYGPYVRIGKTFVSVPKDKDINTLTLPEAIALYEQKIESDKNKVIKTFPEDKNVQVLNGRYGPYIKIGRKNYKIPKDYDPKELSLEDCKKIAEEQAAKKKK